MIAYSTTLQFWESWGRETSSYHNHDWCNDQLSWHETVSKCKSCLLSKLNVFCTNTCTTQFLKTLLMCLLQIQYCAPKKQKIYLWPLWSKQVSQRPALLISCPSLAPVDPQQFVHRATRLVEDIVIIVCLIFTQQQLDSQWTNGDTQFVDFSSGFNTKPSQQTLVGPICCLGNQLPNWWETRSEASRLNGELVFLSGATLHHR